MIYDPLVIRKARGAYVVSSSDEEDPIQLIRQISQYELEVHLKNGHKYIERLNFDEDPQELILEMMGYETFIVTLQAKAWPDSYEGIIVPESADVIKAAAENLFDSVFAKTPYLNSKLIKHEFTLHLQERDVKFYEHTYNRYFALLTLEFRGRVDQKNEFHGAFYDVADQLSNFCSAKVREKVNVYDYQIFVEGGK